MKLSLKELLLVVAIVGLGLAFVLHLRSTRGQLNKFESAYFHEVARTNFETRLFLVEENFRRLNYTLLPDVNDFSTNDFDGCFESSYAWSTGDQPPVSGQELAELMRPLINGFTNTQRMQWDVQTEPSLEAIQTNPRQESGAILFRVNYRFTDPASIAR